MLMSVWLVFNTHAADDDLAELEALLNEESSTNTWSENEQPSTGNSNEDESMNDLDELDSLEEFESMESNNDSSQDQITLSTTWETTIDTVNIVFEKLDNYSEYKVYYSKSSEEDLSEEQITAEDGMDEIEVSISNLESNTEYQFIAKAFDNTGNPISSTESEPLNVTTKQSHQAAEDNVIYNPIVEVDWTKIHISYEPWVDVEKVQISYSEDGQTFKPETTLDASETSYTFQPENTWKTYIKIVPVSEDWTLWVCKVGETNVENNTFTANVEPKEETEEKMWEPETGPELFLLVIVAVLAYSLYALRKRA